jgi:2-methylisocitrate lyase-like PEP mutase family enzyme
VTWDDSGTQKQKCITFAALHQRDKPFLIPNPWDAGSARLLQGMGYEALATTSSGFAHTLGRTDGMVTLEEKLLHCRSLSSATSIPVNADFENGYAHDPEVMQFNIHKLAETGVAGCSIEDYDRETHEVYDFDFAVERIFAAMSVIDQLDMPFQLTARAESLLRGRDDLDDTIERLQAFSKAGAHVLYAPGIASLEQLSQVTNEIDKPFNVLAPFIANATVDELAEAGAQRISVGGALSWVTVSPLITAGWEMLKLVTFGWTCDLADSGEVKRLLS